MPSGDPLEISREPLDHGLQLVQQSPPKGSPSASFTYIGPAGSAYDPSDREGVAVLVADVVVAAAGTRDRKSLARHLDALGATLSSHPSPEALEITAWGPAPRWEALLDLLADVVLRPRFDPSDIALSRRQLLERQLREETQPDERADRELLHALFPKDHPYYRTGAGTRATVARIRREDLRGFHRRQVVPNGAAIVATSAAPSPAIARAVARRFGEWPNTRAPGVPSRPMARGARAVEKRVVMPGRMQVEVRVGSTSLSRADPAFPGAFLANEVLGGRPLLSRLFQRVREKAGLAYHASSDLESMAWGGYWLAQAGTGPERSAKVEAMLVQELRGLSANAIPSSELDQIRESAIGSMQLTLETTAGVHDLAVESAYYQLPPTFYRDWPTRLRALSPRDVREAAATALDPTGLVVVTAGP